MFRLGNPNKETDSFATRYLASWEGGTQYMPPFIPDFLVAHWDSWRRTQGIPSLKLTNFAPKNWCLEDKSFLLGCCPAHWNHGQTVTCTFITNHFRYLKWRKLPVPEIYGYIWGLGFPISRTHTAYITVRVTHLGGFLIKNVPTPKPLPDWNTMVLDPGGFWGFWGWPVFGGWFLVFFLWTNSCDKRHVLWIPRKRNPRNYERDWDSSVGPPESHQFNHSLNFFPRCKMGSFCTQDLVFWANYNEQTTGWSP